LKFLAFIQNVNEQLIAKEIEREREREKKKCMQLSFLLAKKKIN
jgi:hypothetical protein